MSLEEYVFSCAAYLPLFVEGAAPFHIYGSASPETPSPLRGYLPFWSLDDGTYILNNNIPLYSVGYYGVVNSLKLFVKGAGFPAHSDGFPLICYNDTIQGNLPFFTKGEGVTPGSLPINNSLLLYIQCGFGAMIPMYVMGGSQPQGNNSIDFFTMGFIGANSDLPLSIPNVTGVVDTNLSSLNLYTHGF